MTKIKKINVNKNDEPASVAEKLIDADADEVVLNIPRFSKLAESLANFHLIKREAQLLKKKIIIESVDDKAIELANLAKLEAVNPFFIKSRKQFSDIVIGGRKEAPQFYKKKEIEKREKFFADEKPARQTKKEKLIKPPSVRKILIVGTGCFLILAGLFAAIKILPKAEITVFAKKHPWAFNDAVMADKSLVEADAAKNKIPAQIFSVSKDLELEFPASGKKVVEQKARGKIKIFNAYSSQPQVLIVNTRFVTPDGKIFRLIAGITVPGAEISDGKIIPSSIVAEVIADKAGEAYNIGPVSRFSIPGFQGSPRYNAFYGQSDAPMTGGFIGELAYPSDGDIKSAKAELRKRLESSLSAALIGQIPDDLKLMKNAQNNFYGQPEIIADTGNSGNFKIKGGGESKGIVFLEADINKIMLAKIRAEFGQEFEIKDFGMEYGEARADFQKGIVSFPVKFSANAARRVDAEDLRKKIADKSENELRAIIFGLPGIESANISLWPFWVQKVPSNPAKIRVSID